jgi:hypothetical protein
MDPKKKHSQPLTQNKKKKTHIPLPPFQKKKILGLWGYMIHLHYLHVIFIFKIINHLFWSRLMGESMIGVNRVTIIQTIFVYQTSFFFFVIFSNSFQKWQLKKKKHHFFIYCHCFDK